MITNIKIKNVKGLGTTDNSFDVQLFPGKANILVAPNGFGKSSITTAFNSLDGNKLSLTEDSQYHNEDRSLSSSLSITEDGTTYVSNSARDQISNGFTIFTINNPLIAKAIGQNMGKFVHTYGYMDIKDIVIRKIPPKFILIYKYTDMKRKFGTNAKVLLNIQSSLLNNYFVSSFRSLYSSFDKFCTNGRSKKIDQVVSQINSLKGSREDLVHKFNSTWLADLKSEPFYMDIVSAIKQHLGQDSDLNLFGFFYQLLLLYKSDTTTFKKAVNYSRYCKYKDDFNHNLSLLDTTWKNIQATEEKEFLVVKFPKADEISYGQRDAMSLCVNLQMLRTNMEKKPGKYIIIIDEVFDYLDAMNLTITQYYLSTLIRDFKLTRTLYPVIMTHLDPQIFNNYSFKKMKVTYLMGVSKKRDSNLRKLLISRNDALIKEDISHYLLHYATDTINRAPDFETLGLPKEWGENLNFLSFCAKEITNYINDKSYDPYAVCIAVRVRVEKLAYSELMSESDRSNFINIHMTRCKLEYVEGLQFDLPDLYYMLGIIYNDAEHLYDDGDKPVIYRLTNYMIKTAIKGIFDNKDKILIDDLH